VDGITVDYVNDLARKVNNALDKEAIYTFAHKECGSDTVVCYILHSDFGVAVGIISVVTCFYIYISIYIFG